ncbi:MAG: DUF2306 domain-containing protein [Rhodobacteraceae bacterium]|nr:DUF2306 domain-containing protein [Paracoccaceae bacterium]
MRRYSNTAQIAWTIGLYLVALLGLVASGLRLDMLAEWFATGVLPEDWVDLRYVEHPWLSLAHVAPGALFLLIGPLNFLPMLRKAQPGLHRWLGRIFIVSGLISALSVLAVVLVFPAMGGLITVFASWLFGLFMAYTLVQGYRAIRTKDVARHRRFMIRAYAAGLAVSTIRIGGILADALYGFDFAENFGFAVLFGFVLHALIAEAVIWATRRKPAR